MSAVFISAAGKSSGKTALTAGIAAALSGRGLKVQTFKKCSHMETLDDFRRLRCPGAGEG